jgi:2-oxoglutarate ferredoxin oxidoreductase subunit delta
MKNIEKRLSKIRTPYILVNPKQCVACWKCIETCPNNVIGKVSVLWHKHIVIKNGNNCSGCKKCVKICPNEAFFQINTSK